jgi:pimeloyl-ACP methyl ester carboxylesterase
VATFGLIHGACGGAWCWEYLIAELAGRGHDAVAVDMPIGDATAGAREYAQTLVDALAEVDDDVIVVGHSLGGLTAPVVPAMRPVAHLVLLGAVVPTPGISFNAYLEDHPAVFNAPRPGGAAAPGPPTEPGWINVRTWEEARLAQYHDCDPNLAHRSWERLRRQSMTPRTEISPLERWPDVPSTYVLMTDDRAVNNDWSRQVAIARTGHDPIEIPGGHSPFLSRPQLLADVLCGFAE